MKFSLRNIPLPPSHNHAYMTIPGTMRRTKSAEYRKYIKNEWEYWSLMNRQEVLKIKRALETVRPYPILRVDAVIGIKRDRLFWKLKKTPRPMDAFNYLKIVHDLVAKEIGVDDSHFFSGLVEKCEVGQNDNECVTLILTQTTSRKMSQVLAGLL